MLTVSAMLANQIELCLYPSFTILEHAAGHLRWKVDYPPSQLVGLGFKPHWRLTTG